MDDEYKALFIIEFIVNFILVKLNSLVGFNWHI